MEPNIAIIMESRSNFPIAEKICYTLDDLEVTYSLNIYSECRTPIELSKFVNGIDNLQNYKVIIAIAKLSSSLGEAIASQTTKPVIEVPVMYMNLDCMTSLMPSGIPIASDDIDVIQNASLMAARIVSITSADSAIGLTGRLENYIKKKREAVLDDNKKADSSFRVKTKRTGYRTSEEIFEDSTATFAFKLPSNCEY